MEQNHTLIFDKVIIKQLKKIAKNKQVKQILSNMLDKLEFLGPLAGELLDSKLNIYEVKNKQPPIRLYYKHDKTANEIHVFEYEMKTSEEKQERTINKLRKKALES